MKDYIKDVKRTENTDFSNMKDRLDSYDLLRLLHSSIGVSTEAGEFLDMIKKHLFYGSELDLVNIEEEIGDILYYCAISLDVVGVDFKDVMEKNIAKLEARYPEKFTSEKAINRDLDKERKILEK